MLLESGTEYSAMSHEHAKQVSMIVHLLIHGRHALVLRQVLDARSKIDELLVNVIPELAPSALRTGSLADALIVDVPNVLSSS